MHNVAATFAMGVNYPTPAISGNGYSSRREPAALSLSAALSQYFILGCCKVWRSMFATPHGPAAPLQEELNLISKGQREMLPSFVLPRSF
jgi:hypothetical protein